MANLGKACIKIGYGKPFLKYFRLISGLVLEQCDVGGQEGGEMIHVKMSQDFSLPIVVTTTTTTTTTTKTTTTTPTTTTTTACGIAATGTTLPTSSIRSDGKWQN